MPFAFNPTEGPPRLLRFYRGGEDMPVAIFTPEHNLLYINKDKYDRLSWFDQHALVRTHRLITE